MAISAGAQSIQKIAVVDMDQITRNSRSIQETVRKAEEQVRPETDRAEAKMHEMQNLRQSLADRRSVMKMEDIKEEETRISALYDEVEDLKISINKKIKHIKEDVMGPIIHGVVDTVRQISQREGYDLVLSSDMVLYHTDAVDITSLVIQALDREGSGSVKRSAPSISKDSSTKKSTTKRKLRRQSQTQ
jgi:Skp family chaperone for outer membrane proteins